MDNRVWAIILWATAAISAVLLGVVAWNAGLLPTSDLPASAERVLRQVIGGPEPDAPPALATVNFAETCAREILEDNRGLKGQDASGLSYETCVDPEQSCKSFPLERQKSCESYCRIFGDIMNARGPIRTRSCQFNLNYELARSLAPGEEVSDSFRESDDDIFYASTIVILNRGSVCTGVLIASNLALTAAHCVEKGPAVKGAIVSNEIDAPSENDATSPRIVDAITFRGSNPNGLDLALISLNKQYDIRIVSKLGVADKVGPYPYVRNVGYGWNEKGEVGSRRFGDVIVASWDCDRQSRTIFNCQQGYELVASRYAKSAGAPVDQARLDEMQSSRKKVFTDSCEGDSGGPVFAPIENVLTHSLYNAALRDNSKHWLVGITNEAIAVQSGREPAFFYVTLEDGTKKKITCGDGTRYVNVTIPEVREWIKKTASEKFNVQIPD